MGGGCARPARPVPCTRCTAWSGNCCGKCDEQLGLRFQQVYLNGSVVAIRWRPVGAETEDIFYWHNDALGSQVATTVGTSAVQTAEYGPYGKMLNRSNNNRIGYTGHVMDQATGLIYMQQLRPIDPALRGRLILRKAGRGRCPYAACIDKRHGEGTMHPILRDMLTQPVGWLTICGALIILGIPVFTVFFIRRRLREEQRNQR